MRNYKKVVLEPIFRKSKSTKVVGNSGVIYLRLTDQESGRIEISSKIKIKKTEWDSKRKKAKGTSELYQQKNFELEQMILRVRGIVHELNGSDSPYDLSTVKDHYTGAIKAKINFFAQFESFVNRTKKDLGKSTQYHYELTLRYLKEFNLEVYKGKFWSTTQIDRAFIDDFDNWLINDKGCAKTGAGKHHIRVNKFFNALLIEKPRSYNPYKGFKIDRGKSKKAFLRDHEVNLLESLDLKDNVRLEQIRDSFLFAIETGLSYSDMARYMRSDVVEIQGKRCLEGIRNKSKEEFTILLTDKALQLMKKYESCEKVIYSGSLMPIISNQKTNDNLKVIQKMSGIKRNMTTHVARHTFATQYLSRGGRIETLAKILGHTDIKTTAIYAQMLKETVIKEMDAVMNEK